MKNKSAGIGDGSLSNSRNKTPGRSTISTRTPPKTNLVQSELVSGHKDLHCHGAKDFQKRDSLKSTGNKNLPKTGSTAIDRSSRSRTPVKKSGVSQRTVNQIYNRGPFDSPTFVGDENLITVDLNDSPVQRIEVHCVHEIPNFSDTNLSLAQSHSKTVGKTPTRANSKSRLTPEKGLKLTAAETRFFSGLRGEEAVVDKGGKRHGGERDEPGGKRHAGHENRGHDESVVDEHGWRHGGERDEPGGKRHGGERDELVIDKHYSRHSGHDEPVGKRHNDGRSGGHDEPLGKSRTPNKVRPPVEPSRNRDPGFSNRQPRERYPEPRSYYENPPYDDRYDRPHPPHSHYDDYDYRDYPPPARDPPPPAPRASHGRSSNTSHYAEPENYPLGRSYKSRDSHP